MTRWSVYEELILAACNLVEVLLENSGGFLAGCVKSIKAPWQRFTSESMALWPTASGDERIPSTRRDARGTMTVEGESFCDGFEF